MKSLPLFTPITLFFIGPTYILLSHSGSSYIKGLHEQRLNHCTYTRILHHTLMIYNQTPSCVAPSALTRTILVSHSLCTELQTLKFITNATCTSHLIIFHVTLSAYKITGIQIIYAFFASTSYMCSVLLPYTKHFTQPSSSQFGPSRISLLPRFFQQASNYRHHQNICRSMKACKGH